MRAAGTEEAEGAAAPFVVLQVGSAAAEDRAEAAAEAVSEAAARERRGTT